MNVDRIAFVASDAEIAQTSLKRLQARYASKCLEEAEVIVALGGDGYMLHTLHRNMELFGRRKFHPNRNANSRNRVPVAAD